MGFLRALLLLIHPRHLRERSFNALLLVKAWRAPDARAVLSEYFNLEYYGEQNPDAVRSGIPLLWHYVLTGWREGRDPSEPFSTDRYLRWNSDVAATGANPLCHYALYGKAEGRERSRLMPAQRAKSDAGVAIPKIAINNIWREDLPLVSVVIVCFNYGQYVEQAIRSVLDQTLPDVEILVVEGGSTDTGTRRRVEELEKAYRPQVRFLIREERHFVGDNRNFGIAAARGRYICCLDADDLIEPVYLEVALFLAEAYGYDCVYPSPQSFGGSDALWKVPPASFPEIFDVNQISTAALFRKSAWVHIGGFRDWEPGRLYVPEDWEFWARLLAHGFRASRILAPLLRYRVHAGGLMDTCGSDLDYQRDKIRQVNRKLLESDVPFTVSAEVRVINPWENLHRPLADRPGFLLALPFISVGGAESLMRTLVAALVAEGYQVVVITTLVLSAGIKDDAASFRQITPYVYALPDLFEEPEQRADFLRYLLIRYNVQTVTLAGCGFLYRQLPQLRREFPSLAVVDQLFNDEVHLPNNRRFRECIDVTVVPSDRFADNLRTCFGEPPQRVRSIPHGIRLDLLDAATADRSSLPEAARDKILVGFFGRLSEEKGPDLFVQIANRLRDNPALFFCMTGEGPSREAVLKAIERHGLADRFYSPGFVENVRDLMAAVDIVAVPSRLDGMPLVVLEAQALGKPVVASAVGSIPDMLQDRKAGFLCRAGDVAEFRARIAELAADPELRARMGQAGRAVVLEKYDAKAMVQAYLDVFRTARAPLGPNCRKLNSCAASDP